MFYKRDIASTIKRFSKFPVLALLGPRQSGKTTLAKEIFKNHIYINLEDLETRTFAKNDPKKFLKDNKNEYGIILDEFQNVPELLSYIQVQVDEKRKPGYFILTGSQNFLMNEAITQSLAGRIGILTLLPLSLNELIENKLINNDNVNEAIYKGGYPGPYVEKLTSQEFYPSYIHSYVERDIRQLINVSDLTVFQKFLQLCAARIGQLLNISDIAINCGVDRRIITKWISILEASYVLFLLKPYYKNFNKRVTKTPKIFFYDTGLACSLLGVRSYNDLSISLYRGHLFENLIIADFFKQYYNLGLQVPLYFWRDLNGRVEVDCLIDMGVKILGIEIKSGETISNNFFDGLQEWNKISNEDPSNNFLIYGGQLTQSRTLANVIGWKNSANLITKIEKI